MINVSGPRPRRRVSPDTGTHETRAVTALLSARIRPLRFTASGTLAAGVQLCVLAWLIGRAWQPLLADCIAFLVGGQVNFILSSVFTWHDRWRPRAIARRWLLYHVAIGSTAVLNLLVFAVSREVVPTLVAAVMGTAVAGIANYFLADRIVFRVQARYWGVDVAP